jgi:hypothetical protein
MKAPARAKKNASQAVVSRKGAGGSARAEGTARRREVRADREDEGRLVDVDPDEIVGTSTTRPS